MVKQNTPAWLEMRKTHIGASDAPIILGTSPWKTAYQLWEEKLGLRESPKMNAAMQRGHDLEPLARQAYNDYTGNASEPEVVFHSELTWMMSSLDGLSLDRSTILEIKCPGKVDHEIAKSGKVPVKYYAQLQHQMATAGVDILHYFSFSDVDFHMIEVKRDDKFIETMIEKELEFWNHLQNFQPPPLSKKDYWVREDPKWAVQVEVWKDANDALKAAKEKEKVARDALIELADGKNSEGSGVKILKVVRKGSVNYGAIPELEGVDLEKFRKSPIESWRLLS